MESQRVTAIGPDHDAFNCRTRADENLTEVRRQGHGRRGEARTEQHPIGCTDLDRIADTVEAVPKIELVAIVSRATQQLVVPGPTEKLIDPAGPKQEVIAAPAIEDVVDGATCQHVLAIETIDPSVGLAPIQTVVPSGPHQIESPRDEVRLRERGPIGEGKGLDPDRHRGSHRIEPLNMHRIAGEPHAQHERADADADVISRNPRAKHQLVAFPRRIDDRLNSIAQIEHIGIGAGPASQNIRAGPAGQLVISRTTLQIIVAIAAKQKIRARLTKQQIVAGLPDQEIGARAPLELIVRIAAKQGIGARASDQQVGTGAAIQIVGAHLAEQPVVLRSAHQHIVASPAL